MRGNLNRYIELTKPKVTLLNLLVSLTCFVLAAFPQINIFGFLEFAVAGYLAAGGCGVLNCVYDKDLDKLMPRTSTRAIPSGFVTPRRALVFGMVMIGSGVAVSYFAFNSLTALMIIFGAVFYVLVYTVLLKRNSHWNVVIGGFAGCFAALSGWTAAVGTLSLLPLLISLLDFLWTPGHLWGLAIKKINEYGKAGIPMLPVTLGLPKAAQIIFFVNVLTIGSSLVLPLLGLAGVLYLAVAISAGAWFLFESGRLAVAPSEAGGFRIFLASMPYLAVIMTGLVLDKLFFVV
jgi:heme o synthase